MNNFLFSLNATVPVFAVIVLGHFFKRIGLIDEHFASVANKFVFKACLPCLVFQDLADTNIRKNFVLNMSVSVLLRRLHQSSWYGFLLRNL